MEAVSEEAVTEYLPRVEKLARRMSGWGGAEYDDLYQEGALKVVLMLRNAERVSSTAIKNAMLDYVRLCRRRGQSSPQEPEAIENMATWEDRPGSQNVWWFDELGTPQVARSHIAYGPE